MWLEYLVIIGYGLLTDFMAKPIAELREQYGLRD